ncbi:MAG: M56 family metallopeptidase [Candidatus Latescibacterota bacterium]
MIPNMTQWLTEVPWKSILVVLIDVTLKGVLICAIAAMATILLRRASAFTRNIVWVFALVGLILLPVFSMMSPLWNLPIIPELGSLGIDSYDPDYMKPDPASFIGPRNPATTGETVGGGLISKSLAANIPWYGWGVLAWLAGAVLSLGWCLLSYVGIRFIVKRARPANYEWSVLLEDLNEELNLHRRVKLCESEHVKAAITVGILHPTIVIPSDTKQWTDQLRRLVLSHELAHVKRWDTLIEMFALFVTVLYWFNPLVWFAVKQLRIERERDCDDAVLSAGARPSDYAELLMNIAANLGDSARPVWQLTTISQSSNLKDRLMSILNHKINRNRGSWRSAILTGALVMALVLPISTSGLWNVQAQEDSKEKAKQAEMEKMQKKEIEMQKKQLDTEKKKMTKEEQAQAMYKKACSQENSAACKVAEVMKTEGVDAGVNTFYKMKKASTGEYLFDEKEFNSLGYAFLYDQKVKEAIAVFKLNVKEYPDSWNVYDSLGEAYMVAGKYDKAVENYETALQMNPESKSSQKALQKIKTEMTSNK